MKKSAILINVARGAVVNNEDLYSLTEDGSFDLAYFDPPYNQHPYGSNYFMLNLVSSYERPNVEKISRVSGIPKDWNRSVFNKKRFAKESFSIEDGILARPSSNLMKESQIVLHFLL